MKAILLDHVGGPESLRYGDAPKPRPADKQLLVKVFATAVTPTEFAWHLTFHTREGGARSFPVILGHEFSGIVEAIGPASTGIRIGDSIYGFNDWFMDGAQAEYCLTVPEHIAPKPERLKHTQAASVPISALTAWQALIDRAHLSKGQRVLIHGGAGAVGSFAVQVARHRQAHVVATASAENADFVAGLGADQVLDYRTTPFETVVMDMDVVLDTVGGTTRDRSWDVLKPGGRLVTIAADGERFLQPRVRDAFFIVEPHRNQLLEISRLIDAGVFKPVMDSVFSLDHFQEAYERKPLRGKHVLRVAEP
ncbi:MAG TPA: NADP-dependent oxidoreductase [Nitrospira sp.]